MKDTAPGQVFLPLKILNTPGIGVILRQLTKLDHSNVKNMALTRQLLTVLLLILTLLGVQVVQASPLHDHSTHVIDCGLCHFSASECAIDDIPVITVSVTQSHFSIRKTVDVALDTTGLSYQGRAPPHLQ